MAAPSGAYLKDELRVTDSGLTGLVMGAMRGASGRFGLGLVVSWNQTSQMDIDDLTRMRAEPFALRPIGLNAAIAEGFQAGALQNALGLGEEAVAQSAVQQQVRAQKNPRGLSRKPASASEINASNLVAWPLREGHRAPVTDGCVAFVLASGEWMAKHASQRPMARLCGVSSGILWSGRANDCPDSRHPDAVWTGRKAGTIRWRTETTLPPRPSQNLGSSSIECEVPAPWRRL